VGLPGKGRNPRPGIYTLPVKPMSHDEWALAGVRRAYVEGRIEIDLFEKAVEQILRGQRTKWQSGLSIPGARPCSAGRTR
jgi:hypothetical protein